MTSRIITSPVYPRSRRRGLIGPPCGTITSDLGYGANRGEAIADLLRLEQECLECRIADLIRKAESGSDWAEVCRLESELEAVGRVPFRADDGSTVVAFAAPARAS
jgi:hypothetical protein